MDAESREKDLINKIKKSFELSQRTDFLNANYLQESSDIINLIITHRQYQNAQTITTEDICFTDYTLGDRKIPNRTETIDAAGERLVEVTFHATRKLSKILFDIYYPQVTQGHYYHYTKLSAFRHIVRGELKLKPLITNENYHEFRTFYEDHNILGYFHNKDYDGTVMKDALMKEIYTFCLASKQGLNEENERSLWSSFSDNGHGVRIDFGINTNHPDFRQIFYFEKRLNKKDLVINRLQSVVKNLYDRELYIPGLSKIGAFYLPGMCKVENEVRFVLKKHTDEYSFNLDDSQGYIKIPFKNPYSEFAIKKVKVGDKCSHEEKEEITNLLIENGYSKDIIE